MVARALVRARATLSQSTGRDRVAWLVLAAAAAVGWPAVHLHSYVDEFATLSVGGLMSTGSVLYRDVFSHHFPLPYAWVAVVVGLVGHSFGAVRASIWLYTFGTMAIVMALTRRRLSTAVFALCWAFVRVMYKGHLAMYMTWSAIAVWVVFVLALEAHADRSRHETAAGIVFGLASAVAILSDPLSLYAVALGAIALAARSRRQIVIAAAAGGTAVVMFAALVGLQGGFDGFWEQVVQFNRHYSQHYVSKSATRLAEMASIGRRGLLVAEPYWRNFDPWRSLSWDYGAFDAWAFTGLAYRVALLGACASSLIARRPLIALWLYAFGAAVQANDPTGFRAAPLAIVALWIMASFVTAEWPERARAGPERPETRGGRWGRRAVGVAAAIVLAWLTARVAAFVYTPAQWRWRHAEYALDIQERDRLRGLACGQTNVVLAAWPDRPSYYWYTEWRPVAGYVYFWPWVAEAGLSDALAQLSDPDVRAVVVLRDMMIWERWDTRVYLAPLHRMLEANYVPAGPDTWLSPALASLCLSAATAADGVGATAQPHGLQP